MAAILNRGDPVDGQDPDDGRLAQLPASFTGSLGFL
jgi:hypothetical protein